MPQGYSIRWTPERDALLGTMYDRDVASKLGISKMSVGNHRRFLGIKAFRRPLEWTPEMDALLGTMPDADVSVRVGRSEMPVGNRRRKLGIEAYIPHASIKWTSERDALLGTMSDRDVANRIGCSEGAVRLYRVELGIESYKEQNRTVWTPERDALLGVMYDREVAAKLGCSRLVVRHRRCDLGVEPYQKWTVHSGSRWRRMKALANTLTQEQWQFACEWFDHKCAYCGKKAFLTLDHLKPLRNGGPKTALNIIPACWACNSSKHVKRADKWIYWKFGREAGQVIVDRIVAYLTEVKSLLVP